MLESNFTCPHCWQTQIKIIDSSINKQEFIEDCEICCNPIEFNIEIQENEVTLFEINSIEQ